MRQHIDPAEIDEAARKAFHGLQYGQPAAPLPPALVPDIDAMLDGSIDIEAAVTAIRAQGAVPPG